MLRHISNINKNITYEECAENREKIRETIQIALFNLCAQRALPFFVLHIKGTF